MMKKPLEGLYPAVVTPFRDARRLYLDAFATLLERVFAAGVDGVYIGGNTGEWYLQSLEERKEAATVAVEVARGKGRVTVHVGCVATEDAVELTRHAERIGADAVASLPPYVPRCTGAEVVHYFERLASATALPILIYHFPALTGSAASLESLCAVQGVRGVKFTDMNLYELGQLAVWSGDRLAVLNGHDQLLLPGLVMGACGGVGSFYNIAPELFVSLYRAWKDGDLDCARSRQADINRIIKTVKRYRLVPALKFILRLQGLEAGVCREPTLPLCADEQRQLTDELELLQIPALSVGLGRL